MPWSPGYLLAGSVEEFRRWAGRPRRPPPTPTQRCAPAQGPHWSFPARALAAGLRRRAENERAALGLDSPEWRNAAVATLVTMGPWAVLRERSPGAAPRLHVAC